ncbi:hypothetical protein P153DRAFT_332156 [Dothidotthia symphoricarpi CBS 119687]|uniref:Uncharacterized protein n=1 Tax=Dothidotthia symphoricarpi CBS 119687 TaxID=1392245 RepID=A0A6A6AR37_9PLEO|nr:uncharacterized protein P153DRAFT_332156 [Dothidotthia symphoricarpi CBS 119687]KAF2133414.1 hypothetical protein P153DRAFT_332156 [Dothidotthia symphoricarpi CBS 119687]
MLSYPDRRKFQQIRARWEETAHTGGEAKSSVMVGRKERQTSHQLEENEPYLNGGSKFRRKLSHGLAFISHPLSQRKITPSRHPLSVPSLAAIRSHVNDGTAATRECDGPFSPMRNSMPFEHSNDAPTSRTVSTNYGDLTKKVDPDATPKAIPRSRTTSFIPRPVRTGSELSTHIEGPVKPYSTTIVTDAIVHTLPCKIPTPSPPLSTRRISSPRQYLPHNALQELKYNTGASFVGKYDVSPSRVSVRSRTTPNLVKAAGFSQSTSSMAPRNLGLKRPVASPTAQKPVLQENVPTHKRVAQRRSQIQDRTLKRESLAVAGTIANRRSFGPGPSLSIVQNTRLNCATPPTAGKRMSSYHTPPTPLTVKRIQLNLQENLPEPDRSDSLNGSSIIQPRYMSSKNATTPSAVGTPTVTSTLPRFSMGNNPRRKTTGTPNGLGGIWQPSCALADNEVRSLPRSSTFHNFGKSWRAPPPVPYIPDRYRTPSLPNLTPHSEDTEALTRKARIIRLFSFTSSTHSIPEEITEKEPPGVLPKTPSRYRRRPSLSSTVFAPLTSPSRSRSYSLFRGGYTRPSEDSTTNPLMSADVKSILQVQDYMPAGYWAGRFSTRFDQWCAEATAVEIDPNYQCQQLGSLGRCRYPDHEDEAKCYIFAQLHDMCSTVQATDSLWAFEYAYRKDHRLFSQPVDLPPLPTRKHDDSSNKGAFGRAVRKLTPRKSSLVNLLKGKGRNKVDDSFPHDVFEQKVETPSSSP